MDEFFTSYHCHPLTLLESQVVIFGPDNFGFYA